MQFTYAKRSAFVVLDIQNNIFFFKENKKRIQEQVTGEGRFVGDEKVQLLG